MPDSFRSRLLTKLEHAMDDFSNVITTTSSDELIVRDVSENTIGVATLGDLTLADLTAFADTFTVGEDGTGHDVTFYSATSGKSWLWDESADKMIVTGASDLLGNTQQTGTLTVGVDDTGHDVKMFGATSGKSWLWDESADKMIVTAASDLLGNTQQTGTLTVGVDGTGHDVLFYSATSGKSLLWDESADELIVTGEVTVTSTTPASFSSGINTKQAVTQVNDTTPTDTELQTAFGGSAASLGRGFIGTIDDNDGDAIGYIVWTSDASFYFVIGTKAT